VLVVVVLALMEPHLVAAVVRAQDTQTVVMVQQGK
jgi:hypothetical protein